MLLLASAYKSGLGDLIWSQRLAAAMELGVATCCSLLILLLALPRWSHRDPHRRVLCQCIRIADRCVALYRERHVDGSLAAFLAASSWPLSTPVITGILSVDDEDSFYSGVVERLAKRDTFQGASEPGRGLVMLEIDGLSFHHMKKALAEDMMPTLRRCGTRKVTY